MGAVVGAQNYDNRPEFWGWAFDNIHFCPIIAGSFPAVQAFGEINQYG